jgi:teichuronic acid biosynthesis glycosyltransferase TuaC
MKVLFVSSGNSRYGIVPFIHSQGESLKEIGLQLDYYSVVGKGIKGYINNIFPLRRQIKKGNYDIIHSHYGLIGLISLLSFTKNKKILSIMGSDISGIFDEKGKRKFKSYFEICLTQIAILFSNQVIVKSKNLYKTIPFKRKVSIIPNGVNFNIFKPNSSPLVKNKVLWLADPKKNVKNFKLLEDAIQFLPKNIEIVCPFPIKHNDFPQFLNNSSVFVLSSFNEGSPNVIKEAMACNIPIVSTDVGDVKSVIGNTEGCFICDFDSRDLALKIHNALNFGKRTDGRNQINHLNSIDIANKLKCIYLKII